MNFLNNKYYNRKNFSTSNIWSDKN
jgi:hypothetical protein